MQPRLPLSCLFVLRRDQQMMLDFTTNPPFVQPRELRLPSRAQFIQPIKQQTQLISQVHLKQSFIMNPQPRRLQLPLSPAMTSPPLWSTSLRSTLTSAIPILPVARVRQLCKSHSPSVTSLTPCLRDQDIHPIPNFIIQPEQHHTFASAQSSSYHHHQARC